VQKKSVSSWNTIIFLKICYKKLRGCNNVKKIKLFCIAHAGGSAVSFIKWRDYIDKKIEVIPIELSGRGARIDQKLYDTFEEAVDDVYNVINSETENSKYAIYGHSMGSWIALALCYKLAKEKRKPPVHLFVSGKEAPFTKEKEENIHMLNDKELEKKLKELGGTPRYIFENEELKKMFLPIIRADYKIIERYKFKEKQELNCPISFFYGINDSISDYEINGWSNFTNNEFRIIKFKGNHFFLYEDVEKVSEEINSILKCY